jgi:TonB family protein
MNKKILIMLFIFLSVGLAHQKKISGSARDSKEFIELKKYPAPLTPISPEYPKAAKLAGIQGKVYVEASIDEKGNVTETKIIKSEQETLNVAAMDAIKKTKFTSGISKENKKVKCKVVIPINFKLDDKPKLPDAGMNAPPPTDISDPDINANIEVEKMPALIEAGKPLYPEEAKKNNITGKAFVKVLINREGNPKKAVVIKSDNELFNQPAIDAAKQSKFSPALQKGKPVAVWVVLPFRFKLDGVKDGGGRDYFFAITADPKDEDYPSDPIIKKIDGKVLIKISIDEKDGTLTGKEIYKSDNDMLNQSALKILEKKWKDSYAVFKKSLEQVKLNEKTLPDNAEIKSGSIICVIFKPDGFGKK